jgi:DNA repair exonuclease SbcCD ATPase subunit
MSLGTPEETKTMLNPKQKKLNSVESQRVMSVIHQTKAKLEGALILPKIHLDRFAVAMGADLVARLQEYCHLCMEYNKCYEHLMELDLQPESLYKEDEERVMLKSLTSESSVASSHLEPLHPTPQDLMEKFQLLQYTLRNMTKGLLRELKQCPAFDHMMRETQVSTPGQNLIDGLNKSHKIMEEILLTTHNEEVKRKEYITIITEQYKEAQTEIAALQTELDAARELFKQEMDKREKEKRRVINNIKATDKQAKESQKKLDDETMKMETSNQSSHDTRMTKLKEDFTTTKKTLETAKTANKEVELQLRKKAYKRETEADNWIQKYDNEIGELQDEYETLNAEFDDEKKQVKELQERLDVLSIEYETVVKEQEEARKRAEEAQSKLNLMIQSAIIIQSCWRSYKTRKMLNKELGKTKGGKKGKGSGKGKKGKKGGKKK